MSESGFQFDRLPLEPVRAGTTILVAGPTHVGTRQLGLAMLASDPGEGAVIVTTNQRAARIVEESQRVGMRVHPDETAILDCVGDGKEEVPTRVLTVGGPSDLTGIGMRFSDVHREFITAGIEETRTGLFSDSTLLAYSDLRTISRFVHTLVGRIDKVDGLGVLLIDPTNHDDRAVSTLAQFCTGEIRVRAGDDGPEIRAIGFEGATREWMPHSL